LRAEDITTIEAKVSKKLGLQVKLINKIDPKLIGGVQVVAANQVFDGSLKGQLANMKQFTLNSKAE
jgi:F-type H+-transporting ATPase subunit delta